MDKPGKPLALSIRKLLRQDEPETGSARLDFSSRDFEGFTVPAPVDFSWRARAIGGGFVRVDLTLEWEMAAECVRCLAPFTEKMRVEREIELKPEDLAGEYTEYPATADGALDLTELAYGEVVLEAPILTLCREDCEGLCPTCGQPRAQCGCPPAGEEDAPLPDPRWDALRALLAEAEGDEADDEGDKGPGQGGA